jgi:hypothetical protein
MLKLDKAAGVEAKDAAAPMPEVAPEPNGEEGVPDMDPVVKTLVAIAVLTMIVGVAVRTDASVPEMAVSIAG